MPPERQDIPIDVPQRSYDTPPATMVAEAIPRVGERLPQFPQPGTDVTQYGFPSADAILAFGPEGEQQNLAAQVADTARRLEGKPLWEVLHPGGWQGDDPGMEGGLGCTASVSEALRQAGVFGPDEDVTLASKLQETLEGPKHGWQRVGEWPGAIPGDPRNSQFPPADQVKPGDVIIGYRKGEGGENHSGDDAHAGIVGLDASGNLVVYSNSGIKDGKVVWEAQPYQEWVKYNHFDDGIVVLRAPDNQTPTTS